MVRMKFARLGVIGITLILVLAGLGNVSGAEISGYTLHVWSHDSKSTYIEGHDVPKLNKQDVYAVEQVVMATNYSGTAGVALLEIKTNNGNYGIYWYGGNTVKAGGKELNVDMSVLHTYKIEVDLASDEIRFYIDGNLVNTVVAAINSVQEVRTGGWDTGSSGGSSYDLYIDNVKEYINGQLIASEDFDDGSDDFYTSDQRPGSGDSGEEIIPSESVPEFPFLEPLFKYLSSMIG
jgi:hypothetical protein